MWCAIQLCVIYEPVLTLFMDALSAFNKGIINRPFLGGFGYGLKQMSQNRGHEQVASKRTQPFNKEEIGLKPPEGMRERGRGDETQEDES